MLRIEMTDRGRGGGEGVRTRDHLANVRTMLAWVRLALLVMSAGYGLDKVAQLDRVRGERGVLPEDGHVLGLLVVGAGLAVIAAALSRFLRARARIESERLEPRPGADVALVAAVAAGGVAVLALLAMVR